MSYSFKLKFKVLHIQSVYWYVYIFCKLQITLLFLLYLRTVSVNFDNKQVSEVSSCYFLSWLTILEGIISHFSFAKSRCLRIPMWTETFFLERSGNRLAILIEEPTTVAVQKRPQRGKRSVGRLRARWSDGLRKVVGIAWMRQAEDSGHW